MNRHIRQNRSRNDCIREKVGVAPIIENIVKSWLRWFAHEWKRPVKGPVRRVD